MKLFLVIVAIIISAFQSNAQLYRGQFLAGGVVSFKYEKTSEWTSKYKSNNLKVSPMFGVFVAKKLAAGLNFPITGYAAYLSRLPVLT